MIWNPLSVSEWFRALVLAALVNSGREAVTTSYSGVGQVAWDDCCGQLTVTPELVFRSDVFPGEMMSDENCDIYDVGVNLLVSLVRCVPVPDDLGRPPTAAALQSAHAAILTDAMVVWAAIHEPFPAEYEWERGIVRQTIAGGLGGCVAIETRLTLGVSSIMWCVEV